MNTQSVIFKNIAWENAVIVIFPTDFNENLSETLLTQPV